MSSVVKMLAKVGDSEVALGVCHPAQARVLVRDGIAAWQDGQLLVSVTPTHLTLLGSNPDAWVGPEDGTGAVSPNEMERRKAWFKSFMSKGTLAIASASLNESKVSDIKANAKAFLAPLEKAWVEETSVAPGKSSLEDVAEYFRRESGVLLSEESVRLSLTPGGLSSIWDVPEGVEKALAVFRRPLKEAPSLLPTDEEVEKGVAEFFKQSRENQQIAESKAKQYVAPASEEELSEVVAAAEADGALLGVPVKTLSLIWDTAPAVTPQGIPHTSSPEEKVSTQRSFDRPLSPEEMKEDEEGLKAHLAFLDQIENAPPLESTLEEISMTPRAKVSEPRLKSRGAFTPTTDTRPETDPSGRLLVSDATSMCDVSEPGHLFEIESRSHETTVEVVNGKLERVQRIRLVGKKNGKEQVIVEERRAPLHRQDENQPATALSSWEEVKK